MNEETKIKQENKQVKPKKKHRFLKFLLKVAIFILIIFGIRKGCNYLAESEMNKFIIDYPFAFNNETDSMGYITDNFTVISSYDIDGKNYTVEWTSSDKHIQFDENGNATVKRPENTSATITLTQTYKKLLGKSERNYTVNVIGTSVLNKEDINVITLSSIKDNSYNRDMDAVIGENGNLKYLMGDFKNTYIKSADDALVLIEAYKSEFNVPSEVVFKLDAVNTSKLHNTYYFNAYYKDILLEDGGANVVVKNETFKLVKLEINPVSINTSNAIDTTVNKQKHLDIIAEKLESEGITAKAQVFEIKDSLDNGSIISKYIVIINKNMADTCEIWIQNNEIIKFKLAGTTLVAINPFDYPSMCYGSNEKGKDIEFEGSFSRKLLGRKYILYDMNRNIHCVKNIGDYTLWNVGTEMMHSDNELVFWVGVPTSIVGFLEWGISNNLNTNITSDSQTFSSEDAIAVQAFDNMQDAYDFYLKKFGLISYDNKGSMIKLLSDYSMSSDNASWNSLFKIFVINPTDYFKYSLSINKEIMGHEYTHAVFGEKVNGTNGTEIGGINEAYADVMGCLINPKADWIVGLNTEASTGKKILIRNIKEINDDSTYCGFIYPIKYKDEEWKKQNGEVHAISVMLSNIGYKMFSSVWFSADDVANIWFTALDYGLGNNSTFIDFRKFLIKSAEDLGYSDDAVDFIAQCFDEADILDPSYVYKTIEDEITEEDAADGSTTIKLTSAAITGDTLFDDSTSKRYLIAYSPADLILGEANVLVYEERTGKKWFSQDEEAGTRLAELLNNKYPDININGNKIKVDYRTASPYVMGIAEKFCENTNMIVKTSTVNIMDQSGEDFTDEDKEFVKMIIDKIFSFIFQWQMTEKTPYELCDDLGLIE